MTDAVNNDQARELAERIYHAVHLTPSDGTGLNAHVLWDVEQLMEVLDPERDLTAMELMALAVVLAGANDRRLSRGDDRPGTSITPAVAEPKSPLRLAV